MSRMRKMMRMFGVIAILVLLAMTSIGSRGCFSSSSSKYAVGSSAPHWRTAGLIEIVNAGDAEDPQVAINTKGNAMAVWKQSDGITYSIWANRYVAGTGWGTAELIETDDAEHANYPQVAIDSEGNAIAVWQQLTNTKVSIFANRYVSGTGWGNAEFIEVSGGHALFSQVAIDADGNAIAVWYQHDGTRNNIWANRYVSGTGWGNAELIETGAETAAFPQVAIDTDNNAIAVWYQWNGTQYNIYANRYE